MLSSVLTDVVPTGIIFLSFLSNDFNGFSRDKEMFTMHFMSILSVFTG